MPSRRIGTTEETKSARTCREDEQNSSLCRNILYRDTSSCSTILFKNLNIKKGWPWHRPVFITPVHLYPMRSSLLRPAVSCAIWMISGTPSTATISFPVTIIDPDKAYLSYHEDLGIAIQGAGAAWAEHLEEEGNITLEVQVSLDLDISTAARSSGTSVFVRNDGVRDIWEQGAAAEIRTGIDPNGAEPDIEFDVSANCRRHQPPDWRSLGSFFQSRLQAIQLDQNALPSSR